MGINYGQIQKNASDVKILDCTVRDGGNVNKCRFSDDFVKAAYKACCLSGTDYMEIGHINSGKFLSREEYGKWMFCDEADLKSVVESVGEKKTKLSAMANVGKCDPENFPKKSESPLDMIRCAFYAADIKAALGIAKAAKEKGFETALCMMAVSTLDELAIDEALEYLAASDADVVYIMDSFGGLSFRETRLLVSKYKNALEGTGKKLGMHTHNNMQLALANSIEAITQGVDFVDATFAGFGKGAGNCPIELLEGFISSRMPRKFDIRPILKVIEEYVVPLKKELNWGFDYPYMLTGLNNEHPRKADEFIKTTDKKSITELFDDFNKKS